MECRKLKISIDTATVLPLAKDIYLQESGFDLDKAKHKRMFDESLDVYDKGASGIDIRARVICLAPDCFDGERLLLHTSGGTRYIDANIFARIDPASVLGIYLYVITAGECLSDPDEGIVRQLYAFIWGTSHVDGGRIKLMDYIKDDAAMALEGQGFELSDSICPGFYGMHPNQNIAIVDACGGDEIGVSVRDNGVMLPVKTCSGLVFILKPGTCFDAMPCVTCTSSGGCASCYIHKTRHSKADLSEQGIK